MSNSLIALLVVLSAVVASVVGLNYYSNSVRSVGKEEIVKEPEVKEEPKIAEMNCATMETYLGQDQSLLANNLIKDGYEQSADLQYLSKNLAYNLTDLSGIELSGITLAKGNKMVYIIYDPNGKCGGYTFLAVKSELDINKFEKEIEALHYVNNNRHHSISTVKTFTKGENTKDEKHFILADVDVNGQEGFSVIIYNTRPKGY